MLDARALAADDELVTTLKVTATLPTAVRRRRPAASFTPVTDTADFATPRTLDMALVKEDCAPLSNVALV
jgi:hypothetical protein